MPSDYLSITQAAAYLGVARRTIYNWIERKRLPVYRMPSGRPRICRADLLLLITAEKAE